MTNGEEEEEVFVPCFGVHDYAGNAYLHQGRGSTNFVGLNRRSPYTVHNPYNMKFCNHLIPTAAPLPDRVHWEQFQKILHDPLVVAMYPIPKQIGEGCYFVEDPGDALGLYLVLLSRMSSPIHSVVKPIWTLTPTRMKIEMSATNVQPLVLTGATRRNQELVDNAAQLSAYSPRVVVVTGNSEIVATPPMKRIKTKVQEFPVMDLAQLPMENIGVTLLRRWCRREPLDAPMETREGRRERLIQERTNLPGKPQRR